MQTSYLKLDVLTPVHIGTGDQLDPMGYVMKEEGQGVACYVVDTMAWASDYHDPEALAREFSGSNLPAMRSFMAKDIDPAVYATRRITVGNPGIFKEYRTTLNDRNAAKQLFIDPQICTGLGMPVLPGSSLKGAIRTAVIDHLDRELKLDLKGATRSQDKKAYDRQLERCFGRINENAFKQLKLSDFEGWADSTLLVTATEVRRKNADKTTPRSHAEVLPSQHAGSSGQAAMYGKLAIGAPHADTSSADRLRLRNGKAFDWNDLTTLVNTYQRTRLLKEKERFYHQPHFKKGLPAVESVQSALEEAGSGQMVLRVGHYSQIEYVTVESNAPLTRKGQDGKFLPYGTTRTLADGIHPFGWVRLTPVDEEEYRQAQDTRLAHNREIAVRRDRQRLEIKQHREQEKAERQTEERLREEQCALEERRQAELAAMPPEERQVHLLERGQLIENHVYELYASLENLEPTLQRRAAKAIKTFFQAKGKWERKTLKDKQLKKVAKIKAIIGED